MNVHDKNASGSSTLKLAPTSPDAAQAVIGEVISAMVADARSAGRDARSQLDVLDGYVALYERHLLSVIADFAQRVAAFRKMYEDTDKRARVAQSAVFAAPLAPPTAPTLSTLPDPDDDNVPDVNDGEDYARRGTLP